MKLFVIVRNDLPMNVQAVQAAHAAIDFQHLHKKTAEDWKTASNTLAILSAKDE